MDWNPRSTPPTILWDWSSSSPSSSIEPPPPPPPPPPASEAPPAPAAAQSRRSKAAADLPAVIRCQVEGCGVDLTGGKGYYRKHRVCEEHTKSPRVVVAGQERRFCQQCSRFHPLTEFDQKKRSCRRRLSDHNARRRKPQPNGFSFNTTLPPLFFDAKAFATSKLTSAPLDLWRAPSLLSSSRLYNHPSPSSSLIQFSNTAEDYGTWLGPPSSNRGAVANCPGGQDPLPQQPQMMIPFLQNAESPAHEFQLLWPADEASFFGSR